MATVAAAAPEHIEAMEQVEGEERAAGDAAAATDDVDVPTEAMKQVDGDEAAATAAADDDADEAMEEVGGDEAAATTAAADDDAAEPMEEGEGEKAAGIDAEEETAEIDAEEEAAEIDAEEEADASAEAHMEASEQVDEEEREEVHAVAEEEEAEAQPLQTALPLGRVKRIMRVDSEVKKVTAEASLLIAAATELFLGTLAAGAHTAASQGGRRTVRAAHVRAAVRAHRPTADFLLDCLPAAAEAAPRVARSGSDGAAAAVAEAAVRKPLPRGTRRIDGFFQKVT
ncbi:hypothetical protein ZWY2020_032544 [Hordeum vulgare]|uniref:Predicted protein n=1 Tax=Hordeum vulgare subsp. vulgare TaxID=112509 RepID=F2EC84_HORVV|nr:hypothetical protein ZWY2020_032544 [Hordeum vulgare]BAK04956.1 predicted protein [Hordeum vulgare subsp. vulgare]